jgi:predicted phage terminase large subunit-like protein
MNSAEEIATLPEPLLLELARKSPSAFVSYVLGHEQAKVHRAAQNHWTRFDNSYTELHRGIGKTTQLAARVAYEIGKNREIRIKYVQQSVDEAKKTTQMIRDVIDSPRYAAVFPDVVPDPDRWSGASFKVKTKKFTRDPTVEANGIFGRAGGRADLLIADDICDWRNAIRSPTDRASVKDSWRTNWLPMRDYSDGKKPKTLCVGTCYHVDDVTADWRRFHEERGTLLRVPIVDFRSPWAAAFPPELLREIREELGPIAYGRAYELRPVSSETIVFPADWIDPAFYEESVGIPDWPSRNGRMAATFDFAFTAKKQDNDPDYSVGLYGWLSRDGHVWLRDIIRLRTTFPDFSRLAIERGVELNVSESRAEGNGPQLGLAQRMNEDAPFPVVSVERTKDKITRAAEEQSFVESGRFHIPAVRDRNGILVPTKKFSVLYDEMTTFPASGHDDTVDASLDMMTLAGRSRRKKTKPKPFGSPDRLSEMYG